MNSFVYKKYNFNGCVFVRPLIFLFSLILLINKQISKETNVTINNTKHKALYLVLQFM